MHIAAVYCLLLPASACTTTVSFFQIKYSIYAAAWSEMNITFCSRLVIMSCHVQARLDLVGLSRAFQLRVRLYMVTNSGI